MSSNVWKCEKCDRHIFGDTGYIGVTYEAICSEEPIHWTVTHDTCQPDDGAYSLDLVKLSTPAQILAWTTHLAGKNWYERSDWRAVMAARGVDVSPEERTLTARPGLMEQLEAEGLWAPL